MCEPSSPQVFISYNWGKKPQVKALAQKLKERGFTYWLDDEQLSGGQWLLEKISDGIRGCKVLVACVTKDYCTSKNCRRELMLADGLDKPIIPLKLEQTLKWPPQAGGLECVLAPMLYVDFCKPSEAVQNTWKCENFEKLVQYIEQHATPSAVESQTKPRKDPTQDRSRPSGTTPKLCPTLKLSIKGDERVHAVCSLNGQLFVTRREAKEINVYDASTLTHQRNIAASVSSGKLFGLAACATNNCLYVADSDRDTVYKMHATATDLESATRWSVAKEPCGLSVNSSHNLLVACFSARKIQEYNTNGSLIREISDSNTLWHAIELSRGMIAISHWDPVQGVSVKSIDGKDVKTYGSTKAGSGPDQMTCPHSLSVDSKGFILVADSVNNRILVLNPELTEARPLPLADDVALKGPQALCYDEVIGHLYVGEQAAYRNLSLRTGLLGELIRHDRLLVFSNVFNLSSLFSQ